MNEDKPKPFKLATITFAHWSPLGVILVAILKVSGHWDPLPWLAIVGILFVPTIFSIIFNTLNLLLVLFATWHFVRSTKREGGNGENNINPNT